DGRASDSADADPGLQPAPEGAGRDDRRAARAARRAGLPGGPAGRYGDGVTALGRLDEIVIDCAAPARLARFWSGVLGGQPVDRGPEWSYVDPPGGQPRIAFQA